MKDIIHFFLVSIFILAASLNVAASAAPQEKNIIASTGLKTKSIPHAAGKSVPVKINVYANILTKKIDRILHDFKEDINIGIMVMDADSAKTLFQKNASRYFVPASNQKLFTAYAALALLPADFVYQTRLFADLTKLQNGTLNADVYLAFSGDPTLTLAQLEHLISTLSQAGIKHINGSLIVNDAAFDDISMSPGTTWDDAHFCFGAPISALIVDHNCVFASLVPAATSGQPATLALPKEPQYVQFINHVITRSASDNCSLDVQSVNGPLFIFNGCLKTTDQPKNLKLAVHDLHAYFQVVLANLLIKNHISVARPIAFSNAPITVNLIAKEDSPPLPALINKMLKDSDNTIANSLFKTLGAFHSQSIGTWQNGHEAVRSILEKSAGLSIPDTTLIDGAGTSRYNYVTPQQIVSLLQHIYTSSQWPYFMQALPISGLDGTLKDRLSNKMMQGKIHAKTGTETGVTSLSGYIETRRNHHLVFSIMINGFVDLPTKYKNLEDQICTELIDSG